MADLKNRLKNIMSNAIEKLEGNGQTYSVNEINSRLNQFKNFLNIHTNQKIENKEEGFGKDFSLENFKKDRTSPIKRSQSRNCDEIKPFQFSTIDISHISSNSIVKKNNIPLPGENLVNSKKYDRSNRKTFDMFDFNKVNDKKEFDVNRKSSDLFNHKTKGNVSVLNNLKLSTVSYNSRIENLNNNLKENTSSNSFINKLRDHSSNYSTITKSFVSNTPNSRNYNNDSNLKIRKEINHFSKTLVDGDLKKSSSFINRPVISINNPEVDLNYKNYFEFSPTNTNKNILVTGKIFRNYSTQKLQNNQNFINLPNSNKRNSVLSNVATTKSIKIKTINYTNSKEKSRNSFISLNQKNSTVQDHFTINLNSNYKDKKFSENNFFNNEKKTPKDSNLNLFSESIEGIRRSLKNDLTKKESYSKLRYYVK